MLLDILVPGTWQDSYESRFIAEDVWNVEVSCMHDVLRICDDFFSSEIGKRIVEDWCTLPMYLDGHLFGEYHQGNVIIFPSHELVDMDKMTIRYTHGREGFVLPVKTCLHYGINRRTVKKDTTHVW